MNEDPVLPAEATAELLRRCWYSHDAHWFMSVAGEFGMEAANRLNRRTLRAFGRTEALRLARALGGENVDSPEGMARLIAAGRRLLFPQPGMDVQVKIIDGRSYEVSFQRCFVHEKIQRAGMGDSYVCAVFDRLQGWHDALGLPLAEEVPALPCAKVQGKECRRLLTIR